MADAADYYAVLEVPRTATADDIKKAYRKAALRWHPDKNPDNKAHAEKMFKNVAEAYEVLSNPEKRSLYDHRGKEAVNGSGPGWSSSGGFGFGGPSPGFHGTDPFKIFEQFFGGRDPFADFDTVFSEMGAGRQGAADPFFQGFGGSGGSMFSSSFSSSIGGGGGAMTTSTSTTTKIVNGKRITITEKTVRRPDGTVETTRSESTDDAGAPGAGAGGGMLQDGFGAFGGFFGSSFGRPANGHGRLGI